MNIFVASPNVIKGQSINAILFNENVWFLLSNDDLNQQYDIDSSDFTLYDEEDLYRRIPKLRGTLDPEKETFVFIDEKRGELHINPKHKHLGFSTADEARATNQANVNISISEYLKNRKKYSLKLGFVVLFILILSFTLSWIFLFYLLRISFFHLFSILNQRNMCLSGTLNPAVVLKTNPTKIAVLTNMGMSGDDYPLIRIKNVELPRRYNSKDRRIPVAGSYQNVENQPFWDYFDPIPLPLGVKDDKVIQQKLSEISVYDWIRLNKIVQKFNVIPKEGYYPINKQASSWKNFTNPKFTQFNEES